MKLLRYLLLPITPFFIALTEWRNFLYQIKILKSSSFSIPVISIGNLSLGGTGKTPHITYLVALLTNSFQVATLSRGYGRTSKGYLLLNEPLSAEKYGDEPVMYKKNYPQISVAVAEQRVKGIMQLLTDKPFTEVVLLDDAYQHRPIKPGLNILLCDYNKPFYNDYILPVGNLRELRKNANRADIIIVSKCTDNLSIENKNQINKQLKKYNPAAPIFFSRVKYGSFYHVFNNEKTTAPQRKKIILITAIANSKPMVDYLQNNNTIIKHFNYPDHYRFKSKDINKITQAYFKHKDAILVTTEKDAMRFFTLPIQQITQIKDLPFYYVTINVTFDEQQDEFNKLILHYVTTTARDYQLHTFENTTNP